MRFGWLLAATTGLPALLVSAWLLARIGTYALAARRNLYETPTRPRAAIVYLVSYPRLDELKESLRHLEYNFNAQYGYPVVLFYDAQDAAMVQNATAIRQQLSAITRAPLHLAPITDYSNLTGVETEFNVR